MKSAKHLTKLWSVIAAICVAAMIFASPMSAQRKQARVWGKVVDGDGEAVADVRVTAEVPDSGEIVAEGTTDEEGAYSLLINDASITYLYRLTKEGYVPFQTELEVATKGNAEYNFTLPGMDSISRSSSDSGYGMHPDAVDAFNRGLAAAQSGDYATARAAFEEVLSVDDAVVPAMVALSAIHLQSGEYTAAAEHAGRALELDPSNSKAMDLHYTGMKHAGASVADLEQLIERLAEVMPEKAATEYADIGLNQFNSGDMTAAQVTLTKALELNPDLADAHFQLGLCLVNQGDNDAARQHMERVIELAPGSESGVSAQQMLEYLQ